MKYDWSKKNVEEAVRDSDSYSETLRRMKVPLRGNNFKTLKHKIKEYGIDMTHFTFTKRYLTGVNNSKYVSAYEYLKRNKGIQSNKLKDKLIKEGIKENRCECCGIHEWMNQPLTLQLHHINGNHSDNSLSNLQLLCPNCHSQTENYCSNLKEKRCFYCKDCGKVITRGAVYCPKCSAKHQRKVFRPSKEELVQLYTELKSLSSIGNKYGVSDRTISKWFVFYGLPGKASELKQFIGRSSSLCEPTNLGRDD